MAFHLREQAFDATLEAASSNDDAVVVHGWVQQDGFWKVHAWVEITAGVMDFTETDERAAIDKQAYYEKLGINPDLTVRYDRVTFFTLFAEHANTGPYDPQFEGHTPPKG